MLACRAQAITRGAKEEEQWKADCAAYAAKYPKEYKEFSDLISGERDGMGSSPEVLPRLAEGSRQGLQGLFP